jgi:RNA polymerase sigma factor (sigma-70 family)
MGIGGSKSGDEKKSAVGGSDAAASSAAALARAFRECGATIEQWCVQAGVERWGISHARFAEELRRCAAAKFRGATASGDELQGYLGTLHLEDLGLACACADGSAEAWEYFFSTYRSYLRACAGAMLKRSATSPEAQDLADSLYADLYGLTAEKRGKLLRYFHGRSSLKTWIRAVMAQRHIDAIRAGKKFTELEEDRADGDGTTQRPSVGLGLGNVAGTSLSAGIGDPHRERYLRLFRDALDLALKNIDPQDATRLRLYYAEEKKLAEIGRTLGEHESSVSRHLEKVRKELRAAVEEILRGGAAHGSAHGISSSVPGLSEAEIELCFEYAAEDVPIDLDKLFSQGETQQKRNPAEAQEP